MNDSLLLVEDDESLRTTLSDRLRGEHYVVDTAKDAEEALDKINASPFDLLIVDVMLPYRSGFDLCRDIRLSGLATPILFLTAKTSIVDKVVGLKLGGDDYLTKPFDADELTARIETLLRRKPAVSGSRQFQVGSIRVDIARKEVIKDGRLIYLSGQEFNLLHYFMDRPGQTISRTELLRAVWGYDKATYSRTVDVHVFALRQKLEDDPSRPVLITTVTGTGYKFRA